LQTEPAVECRGLVRTFIASSGRVDALRGIDVAFPANAITAVVGPSGSGKSSLLRILAGLDRPTEGTATIGDTEIARASRADLRRHRRKVGYVFQRPSENLISYLTLGEHIELMAKLRGVSDVDVEEVLEPLGLADRAAHYPDQLSGGEQQRAAFAQATLGDPPLVVADEPTAEIDSATAASLLSMLSELSGRGLTLVIATHDPEVMAIADHAIHLHHGELAR
jgi:ABC-type lipoprotein export system ATPase subunit